MLAGIAGCTDLKPLQADIDSLRSQVAKLQGSVDIAKAAAYSAARAATAAQQAAQVAAQQANDAVAKAQASQQCCDATNEEIDRMFRKSASK